MNEVKTELVKSFVEIRSGTRLAEQDSRKEEGGPGQGIYRMIRYDYQVSIIQLILFFLKKYTGVRMANHIEYTGSHPITEVKQC